MDWPIKNLGDIITIFMAGFGLAYSMWASKNSGLKDEIRRYSDEKKNTEIETRRSAELNAQLQTDIRGYREQLKQLQNDLNRSTSEKNVLHSEVLNLKTMLEQNIKTSTEQGNMDITAITSDDAAMCSSAQIEAQQTAMEKLKQTETKVSSGNSNRAFDGDVIISLKGCKYDGSPLRYFVYAEIGSPGFSNIPIDKADVGYSTILQANSKYDVRIVAASSYEASFLITKLD